MRLLFLLLLVIMAGCQAVPEVNLPTSDSPSSTEEVTPTETVNPSEAVTPTPQPESTDMGEMLREAERNQLITANLTIQKAGERTYGVTPQMAQTITGLMKQAVEQSSNEVFNDRDYDMKQVDLTLHLAGYQPLLFNLKYDYFHFPGDYRVYGFGVNGSSGGMQYKWSHLIHEQQASGVVYTRIEQKTLNPDNPEVDLDGDGSKEKVQFIYNGDLKLRVNDSEEVVYANLPDFDIHFFAQMIRENKVLYWKLQK